MPISRFSCVVVYHLLSTYPFFPFTLSLPLSLPFTFPLSLTVFPFLHLPPFLSLLILTLSELSLSLFPTLSPLPFPFTSLLHPSRIFSLPPPHLPSLHFALPSYLLLFLPFLPHSFLSLPFPSPYHHSSISFSLLPLSPCPLSSPHFPSTTRHSHESLRKSRHRGSILRSGGAKDALPGLGRIFVLSADGDEESLRCAVPVCLKCVCLWRRP